MECKVDIGKLLRRTILLSVTLAFFSIPLLAQQIYDYTPLGSRSKGLGGSYLTHKDLWSALNNPASLSQTTHPVQAGVYYENGYLAKELNLTGVGITYETPLLNLGLKISRMGFFSYNQGAASISFSKEVWKDISVGAKIVYHYIQAAGGIGSVAALTAEVGATAAISEVVTLGIHVINPSNESIGKEVREPLPSALAAGFGFITPWNLTLYGELVGATNRKVGVRSGIEWSVFSKLFARVGYSQNPSILSVGMGYWASFGSFDFSITQHQILGYSPQVAVTFLIGKHKQ